MEKFLITVICILSSSIAFASQKAFDLKIDLSLEGKHVATPRIRVKEGEKGVIIQESNNQKNFIEVIATEDVAPNNKQSILMEFVVGKIAKDGSRTIISQPRIYSIPNEKAQITISEENGKETLNLSVIANKAAL